MSIRQRVYSGGLIDILDVNPSLVEPIDIARQLSRAFRFRGASPITVAQHSVAVSRMLRGRDLRLAGLLHDAHEYILGDTPSPAKAHVTIMGHPLRDVEDWAQENILAALSYAFDGDPMAAARDQRVKAVDIEATETERRLWIHRQRGKETPLEMILASPWEPEAAFKEWLSEYGRLARSVV